MTGQVLSTSISRKVYFPPPLSDLTAPINHVRFWVNSKPVLAAGFQSVVRFLFFCIAFRQIDPVRGVLFPF